MFEALKKKISSWFKKPEEAKEKPVKKLEKVEDELEKETLKKIKKSENKEIQKKKNSKETKEAGEEKKHIEKIEKKAEEEVKEVEEEIRETEKSQEKEFEKPKEIEKREEKEEGFFSKIFKKITRSTVTLEKKDLDEIFSEIEITLLENNVALEVSDKIKENLSKDLVGIEVKKEGMEKTIKESLKKSILEVLIEPDDLIKKIKSHSGIYTIIFFGINGSGKTTSIAKLAHLLGKNKISCVLAAGDTFRAASIEQLKKHGENLKIPVISHEYGSDPASVAFDAKKYAEKNKIKAVLIDTAGRMYTKQNLMKEMEKIIRVSRPDLKIFVGESITGNDAVEQAQTFNEVIGIDGTILTKADVDEKAGTILSVGYVTKKPIYYLGVGQDYDDLQDFKKKDVLKNIGLE